MAVVAKLPDDAEPAPAAALSVEDVLAKALPAVVVVETSAGRGSAFFVDRDRLITNYHVVVGQSYVKVRLADNTLLDARILATSRLVGAMRQCARPPAALVNASAIGYYVPKDAATLDESAAPGSGEGVFEVALGLE